MTNATTSPTPTGSVGAAKPAAYQTQFPVAAADDRPLIWVNGKMVPKSQAVVSVYDHGLLYGDGVFEGIRVYNGKIFKAQQHLDRLWASAEKIFLKIHISREEMLEIQRECVRANGIKDGYIRLLVTRGAGTLGLNPYLCPVPGVVCIADQIALYKPEMYAKGMRVVLAQRPRIPVECLDPRIKSLNYLNNILAKCEAIHLGQALGITKPEDQLLEVIMLNVDGQVTEGSGDNIFFIKKGTLYTPPCEAGALEGITRRFVLETLAPACKIPVKIRNFGIDELLEADEVFMTGSAAEIIAVREVLKHFDGEVTETVTISSGEGPLTGKMRAEFRRIVTSDHVPED